MYISGLKNMTGMQANLFKLQVLMLFSFTMFLLCNSMHLYNIKHNINLARKHLLQQRLNTVK